MYLEKKRYICQRNILCTITCNSVSKMYLEGRDFFHDFCLFKFVDVEVHVIHISFYKMVIINNNIFLSLFSMKQCCLKPADSKRHR